MNKLDALKSVFDLSEHYYLLTVNMKGQYTYLNENYASSLCHVSTNLLGVDCWVTMHPDDLIKVQEASLICMQYPDRQVPLVIRKHDGLGGFMHTQWEFSAIVEEETGTTTGICCLGYNITKTVEEQNRLLESHHLIAAKDEALNTIGFIQSHRIRKEVANIQGLTALLKKMKLETELEGIISMIQDSSHQLDGVIQEVVGHVQKNRS